MSRRQGYVIVSMLAVVAVFLAVLLAYLLGSGAGGDPDTAADLPTSSSSTPDATTSMPVEESAETTEVPPPDPSTVTVPPAPPAPPAPAVVTEPTFVECLFGTPGPARFSDGSIRNHPPCAETPEALRSNRAESVCGGLYGWREVSRDEYVDLCGVEPPTGG